MYSMSVYCSIYDQLHVSAIAIAAEFHVDDVADRPTLASKSKSTICCRRLAGDKKSTATNCRLRLRRQCRRDFTRVSHTQRFVSVNYTPNYHRRFTTAAPQSYCSLSLSLLLSCQLDTFADSMHPTHYTALYSYIKLENSHILVVRESPIANRYTVLSLILSKFAPC